MRKPKFVSKETKKRNQESKKMFDMARQPIKKVVLLKRKVNFQITQVMEKLLRKIF